MRRVKSTLVGVALALAFVATPATAQTGERKNILLEAKSWAFQLKNLGPDQQAKIAASPYDLVVIDSEQFPQDKEIPLTRDEVERMKKKPDGSRRTVIAYLSAGEVESYRYYWKPEWNKKKPSWVGKENKEWKENYLAQYWQPVWQNIIFGSPGSFVDRILAAGFDGFYIDRADAYYYYGDTTEKRNQMADFIIKLTTYMRKVKPDVAILVQNAEELLDRPAYVAAIDGIAKEDLIYGISHTEKINPQSDIDHSTRLLKAAQAKGKAIFVIEYLKNPTFVGDVTKRTGDLGFVLYTGPRGLASLDKFAADDYAGPRPGPDQPTAVRRAASTVGQTAAAAAAATAVGAKAAVGKAKAAAAKAAARLKGKAKQPQ